MGGGHEEPYKVPHWTTHSNWRSASDLLDYHNRLSRLGLKDPWIRNYWPLYNPALPGYHRRGRRGIYAWAYNLLRIGLKPGLAIAGTIIGIEELYSKVYYGHTSWGGQWAENGDNGGHADH